MRVNSLISMRGIAVLLSMGGALAFAQSSPLPATSPTAAAVNPMPTAIPASALTKAERAGHRAEVVYSGNMLQVTANNSSLNQILREVARKTGMKITGGVNDERVYGKYGPAPAAQVLARLLDGTGSNMFLKETADAGPAELILTPRLGGPTPPNPNSPGAYDADEAPEPAAQQIAAPTPPQPAQLPFSKPVPPLAITSTDAAPVTPPPAGIVEAPTAAPATDPGTIPGPSTQSTGTSDPTSPNGVKTPQQIYLQLQQLQQQQTAPH